MTMTEATTGTETAPPQTFTVVLLGLGFWACGNTYNEALKQARKHCVGFNKHKTYFRAFAFTEPVHSVRGSDCALEYQWADVIGAFTFLDINDRSDES